MSASPSSSSKTLRVALVQNQKVTKEQDFNKRQDVTVGQDSKNSFVVPTPSLPPNFPVFEHKANHYSLLFTDAMNGKVRVGPSESDYVDFGALRSQGMAKKRGNVYVFPLSDAMRGTVNLGSDVSLLFQFSQTAPEPVAAQLPEDVKESAMMQGGDRFFVMVLAASLFIHFSGAGYIMLQPKPAEHEMSLEELPDRFAKVMMKAPEPEPEQPKEQTAATSDKAAAKEEKKSDKPAKSEPSTPASKAAMQQKVASKGLLKILGSSGSGGGALQDVLGGSTGTNDIASALEGASGIGVAQGPDTGKKGGGTGQVQGIGSLGTSGGGNVDLGGKADAKITGRVLDSAPEVDSADIDRAGLGRFLKARQKAIANCYEKELKRNPTLKGKIVVRFNITPQGRSSGIEIEEDSINNEAVTSCIKTIIRTWVFPFKPSEDVPISYPLFFAPSS